ncbi:hypothetical protein ACU4GH_23550 [Bradyrhizobium betae]
MPTDETAPLAQGGRAVGNQEGIADPRAQTARDCESIALPQSAVNSRLNRIGLIGFVTNPTVLPFKPANGPVANFD